MRFGLPIVTAFIAVLLYTDSAPALTTFCSNPKREGIKRAANLRLSWSGVAKLKAWLDKSSQKEIGMSLSSVGSGYSGQPLEKETLILQSPKVSVAINMVALNGSSEVVVTLERTCINDALEPWQPYWRRFKNSMSNAGYDLIIRP